MKMSIDIDKVAYNRIDAALEAIETNLRGTAMNSGLRAVGAHIKQGTRAILPKPGYTRYTRTKGEEYKDKEEPKSLEQTIKTKLVNYAQGLVKVAIIGYEWPAGAHGHLAELGHDMVTHAGVTIGHVEPAEYMVTVVEQSRSTVDSIVINAARKLIKV